MHSSYLTNSNSFICGALHRETETLDLPNSKLTHFRVGRNISIAILVLSKNIFLSQKKIPEFFFDKNADGHKVS